MRLLTRKQEQFCLKYLEMGNGAEAVKQAGYSPKWVSRHLRDLLASPRIQARLKELKEKVGSDESLGVMSTQERKIRLSQIARASIPDFVGQEGIKVEKASANVGAVQEITTKTRLYKKTGEPVVITNLKLHNPISAIDLLNKMDKLYSEEPRGNTWNIGAMQINVGDPKEKLLSELARLAARAAEAKNNT